MRLLQRGTAWLTAHIPNRQMAITYSAFAKRIRNHFHEAQGCCSSPEAHETCSAKNFQTWTSTSPPAVSPATCCLHKPNPTHQASSGPLCDHAESESYCVVDNLLTAAVHLMYRYIICLDVSSGYRVPPAPSAQRKEKCQPANLEKESCLYEDAPIIPQNKWNCGR